MDDIAEAGGITARALYRRYADKQALLPHVVLEDQQHVVDTITALVAQPPEQRDLETTLTEAAPDSRRLSLLWQREARHLGGDDDVLRLLVEGHLRVALEATGLLAVWLDERLHLPDATRERLDRIRADSPAERQRWLSAARPRLPDADAATLVTTAKTIIDDCARIPHFRPYPTVAGELAGAALTALGLPVGHGDTGT